MSGITQIGMPSLSASMQTGNLVRWCVAAGERVLEGQIIAEIETDKSIVEYESPVSGTVNRILVPEGASDVPIGAVIMELASSTEVATTAGRTLPTDVASLGQTGPMGQLLSSTRRAIAERMTESKRTAPHFYVSTDADVSALVAIRNQLRAECVDPLPSINDFIVRAAALALKEHPQLNVQYTRDSVLQLTSIDVGVAIDTPEGTVAPLLRNVDEKSIHAIAVEVKSLRADAVRRSLQPAAYEGGSLTVSNLGMFGVTSFAAIINTPQIMVLAAGAAMAQAVICDGAISNGHRMSLTLSCDHRVVDGAPAARFLQSIKFQLAQAAGLIG